MQRAASATARCIHSADGGVELRASCWRRPTGSPTCWCEDMGLVPGNRVLLRGAEQPDDGRLLVRGAEGRRHRGRARCRCCARGARPTSSTRRRSALALCDARLADELQRRRRDARSAARRAASTTPDDRTRWKPLMARQAGATSPTSTPPPTTSALIAFTSGTTGQRQGHDAFPPRRAWRSATASRARPARRTPTTSSCGIAAAGLHLRARRAGALPDARRRVGGAAREGHARRLLEAIERHRRHDPVHRADRVPRAWPQHGEATDLTSLRKCVSAGETLAGGDLRARGARRPASNSSTASARPRCCTSSSPPTRRRHPPRRDRQGGARLQARVVDDDGNAVPPGTVGRLAVQGPDRLPLPRRPERQTEYVQNGWNLHRRRLHDG